MLREFYETLSFFDMILIAKSRIGTQIQTTDSM